jgi:hypothetical protein
LQPENINPGNAKNAETLHKAPNEAQNQTNDEGETQSPKIDPPLAFVGHPRKRSTAQRAKTAMAIIAMRSISRHGDSEYSMRMKAPMKARADR